ncbi:hypothetical protein FFF34_005625 [Inquilinus sp. KBS0705]|nr:hypothetical protein FFF34_005625 [Inquilinus sp. KBS0705]
MQIVINKRPYVINCALTLLEIPSLCKLNPVSGAAFRLRFTLSTQKRIFAA